MKPGPLVGEPEWSARLRQCLGEAPTGGEELASMSDATTTDLYEVRVAVSPLREATTGPATFSLFVRKLPSDRGFLVGTGLESALDFLSGFRIGAEDADAFATVRHRPPADVDTLLGVGFTGQVRVVPEGRIVLTGEPLLEVTAPLPQAQLFETYVLSQVTSPTASNTASRKRPGQDDR